MAVDERRIAILGAGQIGEALLTGLLSSGWRAASELSASARREERAAELRERHGVTVTLSNAEAAAGAALVVIAVKPQDIETLLGEVGPLLQPEQTVLSVAAAIPTAAIERHLGSGVPVVRAMPNTPATVHEGIAGICAGAHAGEEHLTLAEEALRHLGAVVRVSEPYMDAVTAVSGSGPAYFALLAEAMIEAGHSARALARDLDAARRPDDARHREAAARPRNASRRAARDGHLPGRDNDRGDSRARAGRRARRVPERDSGRDGPLETSWPAASRDGRAPGRSRIRRARLPPLLVAAR